MVMIGNVH
jgi:methionyl aminopeptidase